jgi:hypothetical protein
MNCAEFIDIVKSGQPIVLRRHSKEYVRLSENALSVVIAYETHICLWLASNRKFKRILRRFGDDIRAEETTHFLHQWQEIGTARDWTVTNFPGFQEIATFVYLTLIPEYWAIYLEVDGKPAEEALPLVEHEGIHMDSGGDYDN